MEKPVADGEIKVAVVEADKSKKPKPPSLCALYRYATFKDGLYLAAGSLAVLISGCNQPLQLVVFGRLMDSFNITDKAAVKDQVLFFAGMYALLGMQQLLTVAVQTSCFATVAARQAQRMRLAYFRSLVRKPMTFFDAPGCDAGALASSVMEKAAIVQVGIGDDLAQLAQRGLAFIVGFGAAMYFCWQLALVSFAAVPLLAVVVGAANAAYARATKNSAQLLDSATSTPLEAVGAIRTVHAFGREAALLDKYATACRHARKQGLAQGRASAFLEAVTSPIMYIMFGGCLWYGSSLVSGDMEVSSPYGSSRGAPDASPRSHCELSASISPQEHAYCRLIGVNGTRQDPDPWRCQTGGDVLT